MKLLIDLGNTSAKWAWLDGEALRDAGGLTHRGESIARVLDALRAVGHAPEQVLIASVAGTAVTGRFADAVSRAFGATVHIAETEAAAAGVRNGYKDPRQLGVDRWLAMLAAYARWRSSVCVVDAGTALTIDIVGADGGHQGGLIIPGVALMRDALVGQTGGIAAATRLLKSPPATDGFWGRDTDNCIQRGARLAAACFVEGCMKTLHDSGTKAMLVLTGGDADVLLGTLSITAELRPLLVLEGLAIRYGGPGS